MVECRYDKNEIFNKILSSNSLEEIKKISLDLLSSYSTVKTIYNCNEIVLYENYAEIIIYRKKQGEIARAKIDLDKVDKIKEYQWYVNSKHISVYTYDKENNKKIITLSRLILGLNEKKFVVDFIDRNPLNNRESNLRIVTAQQRQFNQKEQKNNTSGFRGVSWNKNRQKWRAYIKYNKIIYLGYYEKFEEAKKARINAELKYFGEFSPLWQEDQ